MALEDLAYGLDLFLYVMSRGSEPASTTGDYAAIVKAALRKAYWDILDEAPWPWAMSPTPGVLSIQAAQQVSVNSISGTTWTLSATISTTRAGWKVYLVGAQVPYRVSAHTAGTATLTVDATFAESVTAGSAWLVKDEYALASDVLKPWPPMTVRALFHRTIDLYPVREFRERYGYLPILVPGYTDAAMIDRYDENQAPLLTIHPPSTDAFTLEYPYTKRKTLDFTGSGAGDTPVLPQEDRWVIGERALYDLRETKDDTLADSANLLHVRKLDTMKTKYLGFPSRVRGYVRRGASLAG